MPSTENVNIYYSNIISKNIFVIQGFLHQTIEIIYGESICHIQTSRQK